MSSHFNQDCHNNNIMINNLNPLKIIWSDFIPILRKSITNYWDISWHSLFLLITVHGTV